MYRALVYERQIAQSASVSYYAAEIAGQFRMEVTPAPGHSLEEVEAAAAEVIDSIIAEPPTDAEMERAVNRIEMQHYRTLTRVGGFGGRADALNYFNVFAGDPGRLNGVMDDYRKVTKEDVMGVQRQIMSAGRVRMRVWPEAALAPAATGVDRGAQPAGGPAPSFTPPQPRRGRLDNGLEVIVAGKAGLPLASFSLLARAGAAGDPSGMPGLSSFMAAMLPEGTARRGSPEIAAAFEQIGSRLVAEARKEVTLLTAETLNRHWRQALELAADVARNAAFPEQELERVRRERITDLRRARDEAGFVAETNFGALALGAESPYAHSNLGREATVAAALRDDLAARHRAALRPEGLCLLVAGDIGLDDALEAAAVYFGDWAPAADGGPGRAGGGGSGNGVNGGGINRGGDGNGGNGSGGDGDGPRIYLIDKPGAAQSVIRAGMPLAARGHLDYMALAALNYAFGGQFSARLNRNLRQDKGYSYGYHSAIAWYNAPSLLSAGGSVQTAVTGPAVSETLREFGDISGGRPLTGEELEDARNGLRLGYPAGFERPAQVLGQLASLAQFNLPDDYFASFEERLAGVSLDDTRRVGAEYLGPSRLAVLVVGDRAQVEQPLRELGYGLTLLDAEGAVVG